MPRRWGSEAAACERAAFILALIIPVVACVSAGEDPVGPGTGGSPLTLDSAETRILFVGNSLTYTNDLPAVVASLARAAGRSLAYATLTQPGWSLEEHWHAGAADHIRALAPDYVVLQQGPSTLPESRAHLVLWTQRFAPAIRQHGGIPALFSVWPPRHRFQYFGDVADSYAAAAREVGGAFVPAGETWLRAWEIDPGIRLYGPDDFHPGYHGTLAAAYTIVSVLLDVPPDSMPALADGSREADLATLRKALEGSLRTASKPD